jgi:DNA-binding MarR family transcriptional regulator
MSASRFALMRLIANAESDIGVLDLARMLGINPAAVTRNVKELENEGFILRRTDPKDKRRVYVRLSPKGLKAFQRIHERNHELERGLAAVIPLDQMEIASEVLAKLRNFIENETNGESL